MENNNPQTEDSPKTSGSRNAKSASLFAFLTIIVLFVGLYNLMSGWFNGLNKAWLTLVLILLAAKLYAFFVVAKKYAAERAQELALNAEEARSNKSLKKVARAEARRSYFGELGSYLWVFLVIFLLRAFLYEPFKIPSGSMQPTLEIGDYILVNKYHYRIEDPIWQKTLLQRNPVKRGDVVVFKSPSMPNEDWIKRVIGKEGDIVRYNELTQELSIISSCETPFQAANTLYSQDNLHRRVSLADFDKEDTTLKGCVEREVSYGKFTESTFFANGSYQKQRTETLTLDDGSTLSHYTLQNPAAFAYAQVTSGSHQAEVNSPLVWVVPANHFFVMGDNRDNSEDSRFVGFVPYESIVGKAEYIWFALRYDALGQNIQGVNFDRIFTNIYAPANP